MTYPEREGKGNLEANHLLYGCWRCAHGWMNTSSIRNVIVGGLFLDKMRPVFVSFFGKTGSVFLPHLLHILVVIEIELAFNNLPRCQVTRGSVSVTNRPGSVPSV